MENASKALIIAGAILLSILIISLGLMVYNQAKETIGSVNLSQQEIEAFNAKFTAYEDVSVSGSKVNSLIQTVIASNQQAINDNTNNYITITFPSISAPTSNTSGKVEVAPNADGVDTVTNTGTARVTTGKKYDVVLGYNKSVVSTITVTDTSNTPK